MYDISVIVATLRRDTLTKTVESIRNQLGNISIQLLVRYDPEVNEYISRDLAVKDADSDYIAFVDDDAYYDNNAVVNALKYLRQGYQFVEATVTGNIFGRGNTTLTSDYLGVGTAQFMTRKAYEEVSGFPDYGSKPSDGWRQDTALLYKIINIYGGESYIHAHDVIVHHPDMMQSQWNPYIEIQFYNDYKSLIHKYIYPIDDRIKDIVAHIDLLTYVANLLGKDKFNEIILSYNRALIHPEVYEIFEKIKRKGGDKIES